jgi:hypothetical protein
LIRLPFRYRRHPYSKECEILGEINWNRTLKKI